MDNVYYTVHGGEMDSWKSGGDRVLVNPIVKRVCNMYDHDDHSKKKKKMYDHDMYVHL